MNEVGMRWFELRVWELGLLKGVARPDPERDIGEHNMKSIFQRLKSNEAGFTLAELEIVVALARVILPNLGRFANEGQRGSLAAELSSVQTAIDAYGVDNQVSLLPTVSMIY
jgi:hypothetical protein